MNNLSNQALRFALFSWTLVLSAQFACAQAPATSCMPSSDTVVAPIKRVKQPTKKVAVDWTTMPSTYSHDSNGQRVDQYAVAVEPQSNDRQDYVRSGFRHTRSSLQAGFSSDHYHITEQWGQPVQPYGQWRYPTRPFSVPYGAWGPQLPQVVGGIPWFGTPGNPGQNHPMGNGPPGGGNNPWVGSGAGIGPGSGQWPSVGPWGAGNPTGFGGGQFGNGQPGNGNGQPGFGNGSFGGGFGVGPNNVLPASQDEYYQQSPSLMPR